ncbi:MAG TPA: 50S ribosomal protein L21 [Actinomycetota bacterium]|nr:50S ribosomal protein L21 [Actinomycetota bacterium]
MYAIIRAGGKQHKVAPGDVIEIERLKDGSDSVEFTPLLVVEDSGTARSERADLEGARVVGKVVGETKGPKVEVNKFRNKTGYRRHAGHRQKYTTIQIGDITLGGGGKRKAPAAAAATSEEGSNDGA